MHRLPCRPVSLLSLAAFAAAVADEWEQSIRDSHPSNAETEAALATHRQEVQQIRTALQKYSKHIEQLAAAANTLADSSGSSMKAEAAGAVAPSEADVQQALDTLRSAAARVKWF
jgi:protein subunit release factor A